MLSTKNSDVYDITVTPNRQTYAMEVLHFEICKRQGCASP